MGAFFIVIFVGIAVAVTNASQRGSKAAWEAAASHLQLEYTPGSMFGTPRLLGTVREVRVEVEVQREGGRGSSATTRYAMTLSAAMPPVTFRRQRTTSFLRQFAGGHDVVVGDPRFDDSIVVDSSHARDIVEFLTPARRAAILSVFTSWDQVSLNDRGVTVTVPGVARDATEIVSTVNRLVDTCRVLSDNGMIDAALRHRDEGDLHLAAGALRVLNDGPDTNVVTQMLEAETLVAAGESVKAVEIVEDVAEALPADPEIDRWRDFLASDAPTLAESPNLEQQSVIDDLFADTRYGVDIDARYAEAYAEREITWTGTVQQSRGYRSDADFGTEPGTKTTVDIGAIGSSRLMSNRVRAVVDLPDDTPLRAGDTVTFCGTLLHVDRFTRAFYVRDAVLV